MVIPLLTISLFLFVEKIMKSFTNSVGREVPFLPISMDKIQELQSKIKRKYEKNNEPLEPPTREFEVMGGGKQKEILDDTNVVTDEEKELLSNHQNALTRLNSEISEMVKRYVIVKGIDFLNVKKDLWDDWKDERELLGLDIPESQAQGKLEFGLDMLIVTPDDFENLYTESTIASFTGLKKEDADKFRDLFLGGMERTREERLNTLTEIIFGNNGSSLDIQPEISGNRDSVDVWEVAEGIPETEPRG